MTYSMFSGMPMLPLVPTVRSLREFVPEILVNDKTKRIFNFKTFYVIAVILRYQG
jgi:hypothetical protein